MTNVPTFADLADQVADFIGDEGFLLAENDYVTRVEMFPMADGSTRLGALIHTYDDLNELEQTFRIVSPPKENAPAWVSATSWTYEVQEGDSWRVLVAAS